MDVDNQTNSLNGGKSSNTSGQIVMASTDSESVAKLTPPRDDIEPVLNVEEKMKGTNITTEASSVKEFVKTVSEGSHGASSGAWQPLLEDNIDGSSSVNATKVTIPELVSSPMDTPSTALQNLDDCKPAKKQTTNQGSKTNDNSVQVHSKKTGDKVSSTTTMNQPRASFDGSDSEDISRKKKDKDAKFKIGKDFFCWICHKDKANVSCSNCPRSYHPKCLLSSGVQQSSLTGNGRKSNSNSHDITCPECKLIEALEKKPPKALKTVTKEELNSLLVYAIDSVKPVSISYPRI